MSKCKNTLLHSLLLASLVVFPVTGFSDIGTPGKSTDKSVTMQEHKDGVKPNGTNTNMDKKTNGDQTLGWYYYGRPHWYRPYYYYYPYRPYYYHNYYPYYNYYPYRNYYHNFYRW